MTTHAGGNGPLRFGILGAARIVPNALLQPARSHPGLAVASAIAARDPQRAQHMASKYAIARVHRSYDDLINDPEIDAVYNPLPNSLHAPWTIKALEAGKHVLCEKPLASNTQEAAQMADAARHSDRILMEAFHYRYHPATLRLLEIVRSGALGRIERIETAMCASLFRFGNIRYRHDLAGGALMDMGCYTIHLLRTLAGEEPEVVSAQALLHSPQVDRAARAEFRFPGGCTGAIHCSLWSGAILKLNARVVGDQGEANLFNPWLPHLFNYLTVRTSDGVRRERVRGESTYAYQLQAFAAAVRRGVPFPTDVQDGIANMRVIDAVYRAAGLQPRGV